MVQHRLEIDLVVFMLRAGANTAALASGRITAGASVVVELSAFYEQRAIGHGCEATQVSPHGPGCSRCNAALAVSEGPNLFRGCSRAG